MSAIAMGITAAEGQHAMERNHGQYDARSARGLRNWPSDTALLVNALTASNTGAELDSLLARVLNTPNTTVYDKAIDSVYMQTHVGGSRLHHLVDGQHDLVGALVAAHRAVPHDSLPREILGTAHHLAKDLFSVMGLPVVSLSPDSYRNASEWVQRHLGISRAWQADFLQINGMEVFCGALTIAALVMGVNRADSGALVEIAAGSGLAGLLGANPLALLAAAVALAAAWRLRARGESWTPELRRAAVAVASAGAAIGTGALLASLASGGLLALLVSLALSLAAGMLVRGLLLRPESAGQHYARASRDSQPTGDADMRTWVRHPEGMLGQLNSSVDAEALGILRRSLT